MSCNASRASSVSIARQTCSESSRRRMPEAETSERGLTTQGGGTRPMYSPTSRKLKSGAKSGTRMLASRARMRIASLSRKTRARALSMPARRRCSRASAAVMMSNSSSATRASIFSSRERCAAAWMRSSAPASSGRKCTASSDSRGQFSCAVLCRVKSSTRAPCRLHSRRKSSPLK